MIATLVSLALGLTKRIPSVDDGEVTGIYRWLDSCRFDFVDKPFVEVDQHVNGEIRARYGFLVRPGDHFEVMTVGLRRLRFDKATVYHPIQLRAWLDRCERFLVASNDFQFPPREEDARPDAIDFCVASWLANKGGLADTANRLYGKAKAESIGYVKDHQFVQAPSRLAWLQIEVPARYCSNLVRDVADERIARGVVTDEAREFLGRFPTSAEASFASEVLMGLQTSPSRSESLTRPRAPEVQRIDLLVSRLQDVRAFGFVGTAAGNLYSFGGDPHYNAVYQAGFSAVPALIEALDDRRITKVGAAISLDPSPDWLFRVRDMACRILVEISGKPFCDSWGPITDSEAAMAKVSAKAWWGEVQRIGEAPWLTNAILKGDNNSGDFAERLAQMEPKATWSVVRKGYAHARDGSTRGQLLQVAARVGGPDAIQFVKREMTFGSDRATRVSAAQILLAREPDLVMSAMLAEFDRPNASEFGYDGPLLEMLLGFGKAPVIEHLRTRLPGLAPQLRASVITTLSVNPPSWIASIRETRPAFSHDELAGRARVVERLLAEELNDTDRLTGTNLSFAGRQFSNPRICDLASCMLASLIGLPYRSYDVKTDREGDLLRAANLNVWRHRQ